MQCGTSGTKDMASSRTGSQGVFKKKQARLTAAIKGIHAVLTNVQNGVHPCGDNPEQSSEEARKPSGIAVSNKACSIRLPDVCSSLFLVTKRLKVTIASATRTSKQ